MIYEIYSAFIFNEQFFGDPKLLWRVGQLFHWLYLFEGLILFLHLIHSHKFLKFFRFKLLWFFHVGEIYSDFLLRFSTCLRKVMIRSHLIVQKLLLLNVLVVKVIINRIKFFRPFIRRVWTRWWRGLTTFWYFIIAFTISKHINCRWLLDLYHLNLLFRLGNS